MNNRDIALDNSSTQNPPPVIDFSLSRIKGCGTLFLVVFLVLWVAALSGLDLFLRWTIEQTLYETEIGVVDTRWLVHLVYTLVLLLSLVPAFLTIEIPRLKSTMSLWLVAAAFSLFSIPLKLFYLTAQNPAYWALAALLLTVSTGLLFLDRSKHADKVKRQRSLKSTAGVTALIAIAISTPWMMWGAFGSVFDLLSVLVLSAAFGFFLYVSAIRGYLEKVHTSPVITRGDYFFDGLVISIFLLIAATGLSQNGSQLLLFLSIPPAAWLITGLAAASRENPRSRMGSTWAIASLALFLPLAFFDADELAMIISGGTTGEVMYWASRAGWSTLITLLAAALLLLVFFKQIGKLNWGMFLNIGIVALCVIEAGILYATAGQPGFFGDRLFAVMKSEIDLNAMDTTLPLDERKSDLYALLVKQADESQQTIRATLDRWSIRYTPYYLVNALEVRSGLIPRMLLSRDASVDRVLESPRLRPLPQKLASSTGEYTTPPEGTDWNLEMIHVPQVHKELNVTGKGIIIGQTDSGVDGQHPELAEAYRGYEASNDYNWLDPWYQSISPTDIGGHGTGTTSIILGNSVGVAPDAEWIGCVNLARNLGNPALYLDCMQFMFAPYPQGGDPLQDGDPQQGAMIINNSWGCPRVEGCDPQLYENAMAIFKKAGVFISSAAGNNGYYGCSTVSDPLAIYADVFSAGSVDKLGELSAFSSRGPVEVDGSERAKPDLLAPGEQVMMAAPGGTYTIASGTSFSAPHVSGVVALMWSANPALIGDIDTTTRILLESVQPYTGQVAECGGPQNSVGAGILDAYAAVMRAMEEK